MDTNLKHYQQHQDDPLDWRPRGCSEGSSTCRSHRWWSRCRRCATPGRAVWASGGSWCRSRSASRSVGDQTLASLRPSMWSQAKRACSRWWRRAWVRSSRSTSGPTSSSARGCRRTCISASAARWGCCHFLTSWPSASLPGPSRPCWGSSCFSLASSWPRGSSAGPTGTGCSTPSSGPGLAFGCASLGWRRTPAGIIGGNIMDSII